MSTCHNMNIIVQATGGDAYSLNGKSKIPNKILSNTPRAIILNSSHKKELLGFAYQYSICLSLLNYKKLCVDVYYFLWNGSRPSYKHIKIQGVRV